jgi:hypothetical protein
VFSLAFLACIVYLQLALNVASSSQETLPQAKSYEESTRIVAIGDLHGDYAALEQILAFAEVDSSTVVVHTGDSIDRGDDTIKLLDFFMSAPPNFFHVMGNHELMNIADNLNYVSQGDFNSFGGKANRAEAFAKGGKYGDYIRSLGRP